MIKEKPKLDEKDRKILTLLKEDPEISQSEIAERIGISQPSVGVRLRKLRERGIIAHLIGMNFKKVGLHLAKVDITTKDTAKILKFFKGCPYFLNGLITSGKNNLCLFFMSEDIASLETLIDAHLRPYPDITDIDFNIVISPVNDLIFPVEMGFKKQSTPPCGYKATCEKCSYYEPDRCLGCPVTGHYKGEFW
jgi:DNA-binding Lrp family transcriptional regulator